MSCGPLWWRWGGSPCYPDCWLQSEVQSSRGAQQDADCIPVPGASCPAAAPPGWGQPSWDCVLCPHPLCLVPHQPAHPWVQHPAAPSMLSDVQWTALPALLPPAPGESRWGWRRGHLAVTTGCPKAAWVPPQSAGAGGVGTFCCSGAGRGAPDARFSPNPAVDPGISSQSPTRRSPPSSPATITSCTRPRRQCPPTSRPTWLPWGSSCLSKPSTHEW